MPNVRLLVESLASGAEAPGFTTDSPETRHACRLGRFASIEVAESSNNSRVLAVLLWLEFARFFG